MASPLESRREKTKRHEVPERVFDIGSDLAASLSHGGPDEMESKMGHKLQYGVRFIGYLAQVIARKYGREIDYAQVDFVTGSVSIHADGGWVTVQNRTDLEPFLKTLPDRQVPAERVASARATGTASDMISMSSGQNTVWIAPGTEVSRFIRQIARRFTEIEQVLEQAEQIGSRIKRRPYDEYIEEIANPA
jgi:hypothetical protein